MTAHSIAQAIFSSPRTSALSVESRSVPVVVSTKLQALVYDILPSTSAVFSYAIGSRKLSANEQFSCWCSNSSKFVTNNSNKTRRVIYSRQESLHQHKQNHNRLNRDGTHFLPGVDASHVYVRAWALGCFQTPTTGLRHPSFNHCRI